MTDFDRKISLLGGPFNVLTLLFLSFNQIHLLHNFHISFTILAAAKWKEQGILKCQFFKNICFVTIV